MCVQPIDCILGAALRSGQCVEINNARDLCGRRVVQTTRRP